MKHYFFLLFLPGFLFAQTQASQELVCGGTAQEKFNKIIEASNGLVIAVGETGSETNGGTDGFFVTWNPQTNVLNSKKAIGFSKDESINDVVQTYDGYFYLAGYTTSKGKGKKDAWLAKVDEAGTLLWDTTYGTAGDDEFQRLLLLDNGHPVVCGYRNDKKEYDIWILALQDKQVAWEKNLGKREYRNVVGMVRTSTGNLVLAGNTDKGGPGGEGNIWLMETSTSANPAPRWFFPFGDAKTIEEASALITTADGGYAIAGHTNQKGPVEMLLLLFRQSGQLLTTPKLIGGKNASYAHCLFQNPMNQSIVLAGQTNNYLSTARTFLGYYVSTAANRYDEPNHFGDRSGDQVIYSALLLHDGSMVFAGQTMAKSKGESDAWICLFREPTIDGPGLPKDLANEVVITTPKVNTADGELKPNEKTHLSFKVVAPITSGIWNLRIKVERQFGFQDISIWEEHFLGYLAPGETSEVRIPLRAGKQVSNMENHFKLTLYSGIREFKYLTGSFVSRQLLPANLSVDPNITWTPNPNTADETLRIKLCNKGDAIARNIQVIFRPTEGISALSKTTIEIPQLAPHTTQTLELSFKRNPKLWNQTISIDCEIRMDHQLVFNNPLINKQLEGKAIDFFQIATDGTPTNNPRAITDKNPFMLNVSFQYHLRDSINLQRIKILIDGVQSRMGERRIEKKSNENWTGGAIATPITFSTPGEHTIKIEYLGEDGRPIGEWKQIVDYQPGSANLHIVSIGIKSDLMYTLPDALGFARTFKKQQGLFFKNVFIDTLAKDKVSKQDIQELFLSLPIRAKNEDLPNHISTKDLLVVFISSHGMTLPDNGKFFLPLSADYSGYISTRTVDFTEDILAVLKEVDCKKLILLDACHSGAAKSSNQTKAWLDYLATQNGLTTLASCKEEEQSYENAQWQHGAFTKAILDAFSGQEFKDPLGSFKADTNENEHISLGELYQFLQRRVPEMVKSAFPNQNLRQTPVIPRDELGEKKNEVTVFSLNKN